MFLDILNTCLLHIVLMLWEEVLSEATWRWQQPVYVMDHKFKDFILAAIQPAKAIWPIG